MHQKDMERFAFLFLCGKRDREILLGKEKMTFSDLDRLTYISDFLGLKWYNLQIWNEYAGQFSEQFQQLELLYDETCSIISWDLRNGSSCMMGASIRNAGSVDAWFLPEENTAPRWSVRNFPMEKWENCRKWCGVSGIMGRR